MVKHAGMPVFELRGKLLEGFDFLEADD